MYEGTVPTDQWSHGDLQDFKSTQIDAYKSRFYLVPMEYVTTASPEQANTDVLAMEGANFPKPDSIDTRIIYDLLDSSAASTDDQPNGARPVSNSLPAPADSDNYAMPRDRN